MAGIGAGAHHRDVDARALDPLEGERGQRRADAVALVIGVDREHVDFTDPGVRVNPHGDETGNDPVHVRDPHICFR